MKNTKYILLVALLAFITAACSSTSESTPEVGDDPTETTAAVEVTEQALPTTDPTCIPNPPQPTPSAEELDMFSPDPETDWIKGAEDAEITIVEYADFQCPYCSIASQNLKDLLEKYPDDVRIVYRHFPLASIHDKAILATQAAEAAGLQGEESFWAMHDLLYATQAEWSPLSLEDFGGWVIDQAAELGLDPVQFETDMFSEAITTLAEETWTGGQVMGIPGTPYLKVNSLFEAPADPQTLTAVVELIKLEDQQFTACPPLTIDSESEYQATIETEKGDFVIKLYPDIAPLAVNSFIYLAQNNWFDGITFHRVIPGFVAQTGDPTGTGYGQPGYRFSNEISPDLEFDRAGLVAMANSGPESNGSQFFITYDALPDLNGNYTIFGEVLSGMDVVESITPRDPQAGEDLPAGDILINVSIEKQ